MRRKLESVKRKGGERTFAKLAGKTVRIWSGEHSAWWRPNRQGYTIHVEASGIYDFEDAYASTRHCGREKRISFETVAP